MSPADVADQLRENPVPEIGAFLVGEAGIAHPTDN
jgi:hypothetical protein